MSVARGVAQPTGIVPAASAGSAPPDWFGPPFSPSVARGVFHPASVTAIPSVIPNPLFPYFSASAARRSSQFESDTPNPPASGVGQDVISGTASAAASFSVSWHFVPLGRIACPGFADTRPAADPVSGVGQEAGSLGEDGGGVVADGDEEKAEADVRCPTAVCAQYDRPEGVTRTFQVCLNSIEPTEANRSFNLLTKRE